jgi:peptidoglycan/xylan/chitin deacetylase (PgdA/CDA1 family)
MGPTASATPAGGRVHPGAIPPILAYHKIERRLELGVTRLSPRRFARQMQRLADDGWTTLTLSEVAACANGTRAPGPKELAITFDDAYRGLRDHAFPILEELGFEAACFVITEYAGRLNRWDVAYGGRRFAHLAWRDMRRWQARGIEFGSHTATHPRLTWLDATAVSRELVESRRALACALDVVPWSISWPFGAAGPRERRLATDAGYVAGFDLANRWRGDAMAIPRRPVYVWAPPTPAVGVLAPIEWIGAIGANRCAVGTTLIQRWSGRRALPANDATRSSARRLESAMGE